MSISTIFLYTGWRQHIADALRSLSIQTVCTNELLVVDASTAGDLEEVLAIVGDAVPPGLTVLHPDLPAPVAYSDALNKAAEKCSGEFLLFFLAHNLLAPTFFERCVQRLDANERLGAVIPAIKLIGLEDACLDLSVPELLAFPTRDCFPLFRADRFKEIGGFAQSNNHILFSDLALRMTEGEIPIEFLDEWLVLARYEQELHKPSLHKLGLSFDRSGFLKQHNKLVVQHAEDMVLCLEKEHLRQQQRFDSLVDHAHRNLLFVSEKQKAQEQLHREQLFSIRATGFHLFSAVKRRLTLSAK